jgi:hypothetical protein
LKSGFSGTPFVVLGRLLPLPHRPAVQGFSWPSTTINALLARNRVAREALGLDEKDLLRGKSLSAFFHYDRSLFRRGDEQDYVQGTA